jgi:short-subunit dehydrogenase
MSAIRPLSEFSVVITGASSGLGAALCSVFAARGATVALIARRRSRLTTIAQKIRRQGGCAVVIRGDLSSAEDVDGISRQVYMTVGRVDFLINNAACYLGNTPTLDIKPEVWSTILNTNLRAPYLLSRSLIPSMLQNGFGRVVNVTSATRCTVNESAYRISKIGLEVLTSALGGELRGTGVSVMGFNPGWMRTEMSDDGRSPIHAARAIVGLVMRHPVETNGCLFDLRSREGQCYVRRRSRSTYPYAL